jgi:uncharacterized protein
MERTFPHGVPCWVDVETADHAASQHFYGRLLGWTFEDLAPGYALARLDGVDAAAVGTGDAGWSTYVAVDDVDATAAAVEAAGGRITSAPDDAGPGGRAARCTDPIGTPFRLWQARGHHGAQVANTPGAWNFSDLHADDAPLDFYTQLFGWKGVPIPGVGTMLQVPGYGEHLRTTVDPDILERQANAPEGFEDVIGGAGGTDPDGVPRFAVTFTVSDRDEAAATAERLGAIVEDQDDTDWTRTVRIIDPQGARLTLSQFTPPDGF